MKIGDQIRFIVINMKASSLYSLIADGKYRSTSLGRDTWKKLIGSEASLQHNCNKEGFNVIYGRSVFSKARIGITTNNQDHCRSCDSRIGFGTGGQHDDSNTCGNEASQIPDNGYKHIKAIGYILVHWKKRKTRKVYLNIKIRFGKIQLWIKKKPFFQNLKRCLFFFVVYINYSSILFEPFFDCLVRPQRRSHNCFGKSNC